MGGSFHPELDIFLDLDDVGVERRDAEPLCGNSPVVAIYKDRSPGPLDNNDWLGKSFPDLVDPSLQLVFINLGLGREQVSDRYGAPVKGRVNVVELL
jgi:hypothetical protein